MIYLFYYKRKWVRFLEEKTKGKFKKEEVARIVRIALVLLVILAGIGSIQYLRVREFKNYEMQAEASLYPNLAGYGAGEDRLFA